MYFSYTLVNWLQNINNSPCNKNKRLSNIVNLKMIFESTEIRLLGRFIQDNVTKGMFGSECKAHI